MSSKRHTQNQFQRLLFVVVADVVAVVVAAVVVEDVVVDVMVVVMMNRRWLLGSHPKVDHSLNSYKAANKS